MCGWRQAFRSRHKRSRARRVHLELSQVFLGNFRHHGIHCFHLPTAYDAVAEYALALVHPETGKIDWGRVGILIGLRTREERGFLFSMTEDDVY